MPRYFRIWSSQRRGNPSWVKSHFREEELASVSLVGFSSKRIVKNRPPTLLRPPPPPPPAASSAFCQGVLASVADHSTSLATIGWCARSLGSWVVRVHPRERRSSRASGCRRNGEDQQPCDRPDRARPFGWPTVRCCRGWARPVRRRSSRCGRKGTELTEVRGETRHRSRARHWHTSRGGRKRRLAHDWLARWASSSCGPRWWSRRTVVSENHATTSRFRSDDKERRTCARSWRRRHACERYSTNRKNSKTNETKGTKKEEEILKKRNRKKKTQREKQKQLN